MAKTTKISKDEIADLKRMGFVEGNKNTIPENISPVLKSRLLAEMGEDDSGSTPGEAGGPDGLAQREQRQQNVMAGEDAGNGRQNTAK